MSNSPSYVIGHTSYADGSQLYWLRVYENQLNVIAGFKISKSIWKN